MATETVWYHPLDECSDCGTTRADARALWAVRVLDAWADAGEALDGHSTYYSAQGSYRCIMSGRNVSVRAFEGVTREAARLAAAEAVFPELPESERARLGARP